MTGIIEGHDICRPFGENTLKPRTNPPINKNNTNPPKNKKKPPTNKQSHQTPTPQKRRKNKPQKKEWNKQSTIIKLNCWCKTDKITFLLKHIEQGKPYVWEVLKSDKDDSVSH